MAITICRYRQSIAEQTKIEWVDHTFNPWISCTQISTACDNCYAAAMSHRRGTPRVGQARPEHLRADGFRRRLALIEATPLLDYILLTKRPRSPLGSSPRAASRALAAQFGPVVWAIHLAVVYGVHALICATGGQPAWLMGGATAAALLAIAVAACWPRRLVGQNATQFLLWVMRTLAVLAFVAVLFNAVVMAMLAACQQLRRSGSGSP